MRLPVPDPRDLLTLLPRTLDLLSSVEALVGRIEVTRQHADALVERIGTTFDKLEPPLTRLTPTLETLANTTSPQEVEALVALVDHLPELTERVENDVLPILSNMSSVAPDLHKLLEASQELNEMLAKIPGLRRLVD